MKKLFKLLPVALLLIAALAFSACQTEEDPTETPANNVETPANNAETPAATGDASNIRIALIAHSPESILDDGSFNAGAWQGIQQFAAANGLSADATRFFQPQSASDEARIDLIADAIGEFGANILVLPGFHFQASLYQAQDMFPEAMFVLLDASPQLPDGDVRIENNLVAIHYAEEQSGFLAGYAAVMEGYRNLGFMGGVPVPAVVRFGHGFIQGAEYAANSLGLSAGDVTMNFEYLFSFAPDPAHVTRAGAWFASGTEVIFAAAGGAGFSVIAAAETAGASVIGVDVDQAEDGAVVVTSAVKGLAPSVIYMLEAFRDGNFPGGVEYRFDAAIDGVGLPMASSRLQNFTQAQYDAIFAQLASGAVNVSSSMNADDIQTTLVEVTRFE